MAQIVTACQGGHRWGRIVSTLQCGCPQCAPYRERILECLDCDDEMADGVPGFDELWASAPWWAEAVGREDAR